jgi:hypothetical protein
VLWRGNERGEGSGRYLKGPGRCTVHPVCAPTGKKGGSGGLVELGGVAAVLRGGATAWMLARVSQRDRKERRDGASASSRAAK